MNNEQFKRRKEFIVKQHAKFEIGIQKLQEAQAELPKKHNHLTEALTAAVGMVGRLQEAQERTTEGSRSWPKRSVIWSVTHTETDSVL